MYYKNLNIISRLFFLSFFMLFSVNAKAQQSISGYLGLGLGKLSAPVRAHIPDSVATSLSKTQGLIVVGFPDISPAADNGIKLYDVLLSYDGSPIEDPQAFIEKVRQDKPGRIVNILLVRQGEVIKLPIKLGEQANTGKTAATVSIQQKPQRQNYRSMPYPNYPARQFQPPYRPNVTGIPNQQNIRSYTTPRIPVVKRLNIAGQPAYPMRKKPKVHAWGKERNIWTDFYTGVTNDFWDKMINAPHDIGRMPGGWRAPALSTPDPVTVGDAVTNQMPPFVEEMGNMMDFSD